MRIEYTLDEGDYLIHQLFAASKSNRIRKQRMWFKVLGPILFAATGFLSFREGKNVESAVFFSGALIWFFVYPLWQRRYYKKHYQGFVRDIYKERFGQITVVELADDYILTKDQGSETKVSTDQVEEISEIPDMVFLKLRNGHYFLFPKDKISKMDLVILRLKELANALKIEYKVYERWEWK
jgi:hypothetical protein